MQYIPTIYGFKIFGQKGSKYELIYDNHGQPKNQKEIDNILKKKITGGGGIMGMSMATSSSMGDGMQIKPRMS